MIIGHRLTDKRRPRGWSVAAETWAWLMAIGFRCAHEVLYQAKGPLPGRESLRVQMAPVHDQPVPVIVARDKPPGRVTVTVTVPEVGPVPTLLTDRA
jgi:hypothetical protein